MTFILRQIDKKGRVSNEIIGDRYNVVHKDREKEDFDVLVKGMIDDQKFKCYAIIVFDNGKDTQQTWPLYEGFRYYMITDSGMTFEKSTK